MVQIVSEFFGIIGVDIVPPTTFAALIPYLLQIVVGVVLVTAVFKVISGLARFFMDWRWTR